MTKTPKVVPLKIRNAHDDIFSEAIAVGPGKSWILILAPWARGENTAPVVTVVPAADRDRLWVSAGEHLAPITHRMAEDGIAHIVKRTRETTLQNHRAVDASERRTVKGSWRGAALVTPHSNDTYRVEVRLERKVSPYATLVVSCKTGEPWKAQIEFTEGWYTQGAKGSADEGVTGLSMTGTIVGGLRVATRHLGSVCWFRDSRLRAAFDSSFAEKRPIKAPPPFKPNVDALLAGAFAGMTKPVKAAKPPKPPKADKPSKASKTAKPPKGQKADTPAKAPRAAGKGPSKAPRGEAKATPAKSTKTPKKAPRKGKAAAGSKSDALTGAISSAIGARIAAALGR